MCVSLTLKTSAALQTAAATFNIKANSAYFKNGDNAAEIICVFVCVSTTADTKANSRGRWWLPMLSQTLAALCAVVLCSILLH